MGKFSQIHIFFYNFGSLCIYICMYMCLLAFVCVQLVCAGVNGSQKRALDTLERVKGSCELRCRCWEQKLGPCKSS